MATPEEAQQNAYQAWVRHLRFVEREYQQQPVPDDQLPDRYEQYLSLEATLATRERKRWKGVNWGEPLPETYCPTSGPKQAPQRVEVRFSPSPASKRPPVEDYKGEKRQPVGGGLRKIEPRRIEPKRSSGVVPMP
mgnify:FL=1